GCTSRSIIRTRSQTPRTRSWFPDPLFARNKKMPQRLLLIREPRRRPGFLYRIRGRKVMRLTTVLAVAAGLGALAACEHTPQEQAADNIEANAEATADNLEEAADNASTEATEDALENKADATREAGEEKADATREGA